MQKIVKKFKDKKNIIVCAGGTAGHIYPAVSIIEYLIENYKNANILFVGTNKGLEKELVQNLKIDISYIKASGFNVTTNIFKKFIILTKFLFNFTAGFFSALKIILSFKPDIILGMGGYVCAPILSAAVILRIPIAIHEQNSIPGRLNRFFFRFTRYFFISFKYSEEYLNLKYKKSWLRRFEKKKCSLDKKIIFTGNPIRKAVKNFLNLKPDYKIWGLDEERKTIVVFGGSLGAMKINNEVIKLYQYLKDSEFLQFVLISGTRFYEDCLKKIESLKNPKDKLIFKIFPYISEIEKLYIITDLIISRAGAMTVSEIDYIKVFSILIPYPEAVENHQYYNAVYLVEKNMAKLILDKDLSAEVLLKEINDFFSNEASESNEANYKEKMHTLRKDNKISYFKNDGSVLSYSNLNNLDSAKIISDILMNFNK